MAGSLLKLSLYSAVLNLMFTPFSGNIARVFGYVTILLFFASVIRSTLRGSKMTLNKLVFGTLILMVISCVVSLRSLDLSSVGGLVDNLLAVVSYIAFYIALSAKSHDQSNITLEDVFRIKNLLAALVILFAFGPFDFKYSVVDEYGGKIFTLGLGNPNGVSLYVMFVVVFSMMQVVSTTRNSTKVINMAIIVTMFYVLRLLSSRTVMFCALLVAIAFLLRLPKVFKWISYFAVVAPILVLMLQLQLASFDNATIQILGKSLNTGRPELYRSVLADIGTSPIRVLVGDICAYHFLNTHNGLLTVFATLGLCGVVLYIEFWRQQMKQLRNTCSETTQKIAFVALIAILIHASSESMSVVGAIPFCIFIVVIMKIAKGEIRDKYDRIAENRI